jgi:hypothetical protein
VGPRAGLDDIKKGKFLTLPELELRPSVIQPVASHYTEYDEGKTIAVTLRVGP